VPDLHEARGIVVRERAEKDSIHNRENRRVCANTERKHENSTKGKPWAAPQSPESMAKISYAVAHV
jgi:hypothetical protein